MTISRGKGRGTHITKLPSVKRVMPQIMAHNIVGVSPMAAPKGNIFQMRKRYIGAKGPVGIKGPKGTSGMAYSSYNRRDRLRGRGNIPYHNPLLTQDRVYQVFRYDIENQSGYGISEDCDESDYKWEPDEEDFVKDEGYQYELELTNVDTLEGEHRKMIRAYQDAIEHMGAMALLWHDLMMDLEANPHLKDQFDKFQMLRKLSGGTM